MTPKIRVGTSGWADPEFLRDWYPKGLPAGARLGWYSQRFDYVELNSSFYAIPAEALAARWNRETPDGFLFDVKLHRLLSRHAAKPESLPKDLRQSLKVNSRGHVVLTPQLEEAVALRIRESLQPLREAGKLGALLLQLSPSFGPGRHRLSELDGLREVFAGDRLAVELRNRAWVQGEQLEDTLEFFRSERLPLVLLDTPESEHLTVMPAMNTVTSRDLAYLRLHGRNEEGYVHGKSVPERFDYAYSDDELGEIADRVRHLAEEASEVHVAFNNNRGDFAPKGAAALRRLLHLGE